MGFDSHVMFLRVSLLSVLTVLLILASTDNRNSALSVPSLTTVHDAVFTERDNMKRLTPLFLIGLLGTANAVCAQQQPDDSAIDQLEQLNRSIQRVASKVAPAIVRIDVVGYSQSDGDLKDKSDTHLVSKKESLASGIILDSDGYIVTNAHVLKGAKRVKVSLGGGLQRTIQSRISTTSDISFDAKVIGVFSEGDVALLKIEATGLPVLPLADSSTIQQGELVFAVGNPEGLNNSISMGMVSAVARPRETEAPPLYIQTDAAINPGSSGGALVDVHGRLIGMTSFILTEGGGSEGLGFALPSRMVHLIYEELKNKGRVQVGDIGLCVQSITPTLALGLHLPRSSGLIVSDVARDGPAAAAGIRVQDILLSLDGNPINTVAQYAIAFYSKHPGDRAELQLLRRSNRILASVPVQDRKDEIEDTLEQIDISNIVSQLGIVGVSLNERNGGIGESVKSSSGVLVSGKLARADVDTGLLLGDLIRSVNGTDVTTVERLRSLLQVVNSGDPVVLQVERHGRLKYLSFEME